MVKDEHFSYYRLIKFSVISIALSPFSCVYTLNCVWYDKTKKSHKHKNITINIPKTCFVCCQLTFEDHLLGGFLFRACFCVSCRYIFIIKDVWSFLLSVYASMLRLYQLLLISFYLYFIDIGHLLLDFTHINKNLEC